MCYKKGLTQTSPHCAEALGLDDDGGSEQNSDPRRQNHCPGPRLGNEQREGAAGAYHAEDGLNGCFQRRTGRPRNRTYRPEEMWEQQVVGVGEQSEQRDEDCQQPEQNDQPSGEHNDPRRAVEAYGWAG